MTSKTARRQVKLREKLFAIWTRETGRPPEFAPEQYARWADLVMETPEATPEDLLKLVEVPEYEPPVPTIKASVTWAAVEQTPRLVSVRVEQEQKDPWAAARQAAAKVARHERNLLLAYRALGDELIRLLPEFSSERALLSSDQAGNLGLSRSSLQRAIQVAHAWATLEPMIQRGEVKSLRQAMAVIAPPPPDSNSGSKPATDPALTAAAAAAVTQAPPAPAAITLADLETSLSASNRDRLDVAIRAHKRLVDDAAAQAVAAVERRARAKAKEQAMQWLEDLMPGVKAALKASGKNPFTEQQYRELLKLSHPDRGGSNDLFMTIRDNKARLVRSERLALDWSAALDRRAAKMTQRERKVAEKAQELLRSVSGGVEHD